MSEQQKKPVAYRIQSPRLLMRCWDAADAPQMRELLDASDAFLRPWIPFMIFEPRTLAQTTDWLRGIRADFERDVNYRYPIFNLDETELIGETGLYTRAGPEAREIGYLLGENHAGKGYALEAAAAMTRVGFEVDGVDRIEIICSPKNAASAKIPEKLGYEHEGTLKRRFRDCNGDMHDSMVWSLFASNYAGSSATQVPVSAWDCLGRVLL